MKKGNQVVTAAEIWEGGGNNQRFGNLILTVTNSGNRYETRSWAQKYLFTLTNAGNNVPF